MKLRILMVAVVLAILFFITGILYAANGDLIINGNLGVGTTTPQGKAEVNGDMTVDGNSTVKGNTIVNGNLGVGTTTPQEKLDVNGGGIKLGGIIINHVTGTNPTCPKGIYLTRKWTGKTCTTTNPACGAPTACTAGGGWDLAAGAPTSCPYRSNLGSGYCFNVTCTADTWTEAICIGN